MAVSNDKKKKQDVKPDFVPRAALILAGGKSSRMGQDKALLPWSDSTLIEALMARLRPVCDEVLIVTRPEQPYTQLGARQLFDVTPEPSSLGGLYSGLLQSPTVANFACACDMPLIEPDLVHHLFDQLADFAAVVPRLDGRIEPLCAVYSKACLPAIQARLRANDLRLSGWQTGVRTFFVEKSELQKHDPQLRSFLNLNTAAEYQHLLNTDHED